MTEVPYGLLARFDGPDRLVEATRAVQRAGFRRFDAFSPYPIEALHPLFHPPGLRSHRLSLLTLLGAVVLGGGGYLLQYWMAAVDYPINVGGRPLHSWPSFLPVTVILGILGASTTVTLWMFVLNRLPQLYHPVFNDPEFAEATENAFFLLIETADERFHTVRTRRLLEELGAVRVEEVPK